MSSIAVTEPEDYGLDDKVFAPEPVGLCLRIIFPTSAVDEVAEAERRARVEG
jgi:hypothetical protein